MDGWHPAENDVKNPQDEWKWTKKSSTISFKNPKKDVTLYLDYDARPDLFPAPQQVTLKIGETRSSARSRPTRRPPGW